MADLDNPAHPYWTAPRGVWLGHTWVLHKADGTTGTYRAPNTLPYPCSCREGKRCRPKWCPCAGRVDLDQVPDYCCAHYNTPAVCARTSGTGR